MMNMKAVRLLSSLLLLPCLSVTAFHSHIVVDRQRTAVSLPQAASLDEETVSNESPISNNKDESPTSPLLPPVLRQIAYEQQEFQINLGRAMDTLRTDMNDILYKRPDFTIYDDKISVIDPSGVQLKGLEKYKSAFAFFQTFVSFWFISDRSRLQFRMMYDFPRASIRISWNVVLVPKVLGRPIYIDGISYYQLDRHSGKIVEHKVEKLLINNMPVAPPYGILSILQQDALNVGRAGVPVGIGSF